MQDNVVTMLRFAKRAGKIIYGLDSIKPKARRAKTLVISADASQNLKDGMCAIAAKRRLPLVQAKALAEIVGGNCKALAVTDENMARAIVEHAKAASQDYTIIQPEFTEVL